MMQGSIDKSEEVSSPIRLLSLLFLVIISIAAFGDVVHHPFSLIDDSTYVLRNLPVREAFRRESIEWAFTTVFYGNYCPLTWLSLMIDYRIFGFNPGYYHLVSLGLHILSSVILCLAFWRLTRRWWPSLAIALLFALHPTHVEPVVWISSRKDVLSGLLWSITLFFYAIYAKRPSLLRYLPVFIAMTLGLMAKSSLVALPFILLALDFWPLGRHEKTPIRSLLLEKLPLILEAFIFVGATFYAQQRMGATDSLPQGDFLERLGTSMFHLWFYLEKIVVPHGIGFPYPYFQITLSDGCLAIAGFLVVSAAIVHLRRKYPFLLVGWIWFLIGIGPYLQFVQTGLQSLADRWAYLPSVGIFLMLVWTADEIGRRLSRHVPPPVVLCGLLGFFLAVLASEQTGLWKDQNGLFKKMIQENQSNFSAHLYAGTGAQDRGDLEHAEQLMARSYQLMPVMSTFSRLTELLDMRGTPTKMVEYLVKPSWKDRTLSLQEYCVNLFAVLQSPLAVQAYTERFGRDPTKDTEETARDTLRLDPHNYRANQALALLQVMTGKLGKAEERVRMALLGRPYSSELWSDLAIIQYQQGHYEDSEQTALEAIRLDPTSDRAYTHYANTLCALNNPEGALATIERALLINPWNEKAWVTKGNALAMLHRYVPALEAYEIALDYSKFLGDALNGKGSVLFRLGQYQAAENVLRVAVDVDPKVAKIHMNLGLVLLKRNEVAEAKKVLERAVQLDPNLCNNLAQMGIQCFGAQGKESSPSPQQGAEQTR